jgi:hypothetical protein
MRASAGAVWLLGMLVGAQAPAAEDTKPVEPSPDIELLEYLGGMVQEQGRWVGPDDMKSSTNEHDAPIAQDDERDDAEG